jgi:hypothetical protein
MLMGKSYYAHHYEPHRLCENCLEELEESKKEELRPFNRAELETLLGELVVEKSTGNKWLVEGFTIDNMLVINRSRVSATKLLSEYTYKGKPCGVKE